MRIGSLYDLEVDGSRLSTLAKLNGDAPKVRFYLLVIVYKFPSKMIPLGENSPLAPIDELASNVSLSSPLFSYLNKWYFILTRLTLLLGSMRRV